MPTWLKSRMLRGGLLLFLLAAVVYSAIQFLPTYCAQQASTALFEQDVHSALQWIETGERVTQKSPDLMLLRARCSRRLGRLEAMDQFLLRAIEMGVTRERVGHEQMLACAQTGAITPLKNRFAEILVSGEDLSDTCDAYVRGCLLLYQLDEAKNLLDLWKNDLPDDPQPHFLLGRLLEHQTDLNEAIESMRSALSRSSRHAPAAYNLGRMLFTRQEFQAALEMYQQARDACWNPHPALTAMAECAIELEQIEMAQNYLAEVTSTDPADDLEMYRYLGDPSFVALSRFYAVSGRLCQLQGNYENAKLAFENALSANSQDWRSRYRYSQVLRQLGMLEQAQVEAEKYAETQQALNQCDESIRRLSDAPGDIEARMNIARTMLKYISKPQGIVWLKSVLNYDPDHDEALQLLEQHEQHSTTDIR